MFRIILIISALSLNLISGELFLDQFHLLQKRFSAHYEHPIELQETIVFGVNIFTDDIDNVDYKFSLYDFTYRRYINRYDSGPFYSFGFRYGAVKMSSDGKNENENLYMPFYDIGMKTKFNSRWYHSIRLEVGWVMLYSTLINVDDILGLQFTPFFSFGYNLD
ncbi:MAG: hypothetical protein VW397_02935 [Candidatus Margulisiibacteriota bacterium]